MTTTPVELTVNGRKVARDIEPRLHLADFLREELLLTATHLGCEQGVCGACTVMKDGRPVRGCLTLAVSCDGAEIHTLEDFDEDQLMARLRDAFKQHHGLQCGFCTPGMLATAYDLARRVPEADEARIRKEISGNLCRCTGYQGAVNAIRHVLAEGPPPASVMPVARSRPKATIQPSSSEAIQGDAVAPASDLAIPDSIENGVQLHRTLRLAAPAERIATLLKDIPTVAECIPGARLDGPIKGDTAQGFIAVAIGPMQARFNGVARVRRSDDGRSGRIIGRGRDRLSRSGLDGALDYSVRAQAASETELDLEITYRLSGPLAQVGRPAIVQEIADRILGETANCLVAKARGVAPDVGTDKPISGFSLFFMALRAWIASLIGRRS